MHAGRETPDMPVRKASLNKISGFKNNFEVQVSVHPQWNENEVLRIEKILKTKSSHGDDEEF